MRSLLFCSIQTACMGVGLDTAAWRHMQPHPLGRQSCKRTTPAIPVPSVTRYPLPGTIGSQSLALAVTECTSLERSSDVRLLTIDIRMNRMRLPVTESFCFIPIFKLAESSIMFFSKLEQYFDLWINNFNKKINIKKVLTSHNV